MKKVRILSGLLVVLAVLLALTTSVFALDSQKVLLSDEPFDYGVTAYSQEYKAMTFEKQKEVYSIANCPYNSDAIEYWNY